MIANAPCHEERGDDRSSLTILHQDPEEGGRSCAVKHPAHHPGTPWVILTAILLSFMFTVSAHGSLSLPVAFVGNTVVDLAWPKTPVCDLYEVFRDGSSIGEIDYGNDPWYRDSSVTQGSSVTYEVRYMRKDPTVLVYTVTATVTVGEVEGRIYRDLAWDTGTYTLHGPVYVHESATLSIGKATVEPWSENYSRSIEAAGNATSSYAHPGGRISVHEAWIEGLTLTFSSGNGNSVIDSTLTGGGISVLADGVLNMSGCDLEDALVQISGKGHATVSTSSFSGTSLVQVMTKEAAATIERNTFSITPTMAHPAIDVMAGEVTIHANRLEVAGQDLIAPVGTREAVLVGNEGTGPPVVTVADNIIEGFSIGISLNDTEGSVTLMRNSITMNMVGIQAMSTIELTAHDNCIERNEVYGLYASEGQAADATGNWWGSPTGPSHANNPAGSGDAVWGDAVLFSDWLYESNCREDIPAVPEPSGTAPSITLVPGVYPDFQLSVLQNEGFEIFIRDEDGVMDAGGTWLLDWGTFRVWVDGNDVTSHFLQTLTEVDGPSIAGGVSEDRKQFRIQVIPIREWFMVYHNVFKIERNGFYGVRFQVCDRKGNCGSNLYEIYIGPLAVVTGPATVTWSGDIILDYTVPLIFGNVGYECKATTYDLLYQTESREFYFWSDDPERCDQVYQLCLLKGVEPLFTNTWAMGHLSSTETARRVYITAGDFPKPGDYGVPLRRYIGVLDQDTPGVYSLDFVDFVIDRPTQ